MNNRIVGIYSIVHFIVDLACAILVTNLVTQNMGQGSDLFFAIIFYNIFAFALQLPIGIIADKVNKNAICSAIGCALVAIAFAFSKYGIISCVIAGLGNAMFHVGGGIDVLNISDKKASLSGIFVSTGAIGIYLGSKSTAIGFNKYYYIVISLLLSAVFLLWLYRNIKDKVVNEKMEIPKLNTVAIIAIICLIITVCFRSYIGLILSFEWKKNIFYSVAFVIAVVLGKMLGGIIGDKVGLKKTSIVSLLISAILFVFAFKSPICGILGILFFNMTMPITLIALSNILNKNKGMAFGLLTLALFIGLVVQLLGIDKYLFNPIGLFILTIISTIVLYIGIKKYNMFMEKQND